MAGELVTTVGTTAGAMAGSAAELAGTMVGAITMVGATVGEMRRGRVLTLPKARMLLVDGILGIRL